jgi:type IV pilus assembly protein PilZ
VDPRGAERRVHPRYAAHLEVDVRDEAHFLFAYITNISELGLFVESADPLPVGTNVELRLASGGKELRLSGLVVWVNPVRWSGDNPNPGMGICFSPFGSEQRDEILELVRTIAYLREDSNAN